jgi:hypothetical protein
MHQEKKIGLIMATPFQSDTLSLFAFQYIDLMAGDFYKVCA